MDALIQSTVSFLAILNPFALCLYLVGLMEDLEAREFLRVLASACLIAFGAFYLTALGGEQVLGKWMQVEPEAMRVFGGVIFFVVGYNYVVKGYRATEILRGSMQNLPSAIALPFMIGAGTITQSILVGKRHTWLGSLGVLVVGLVVTFAVVTVFHFARLNMRGSREAVFDRWVNIIARLNGLIIGAISTEMVITGVHALWRAS